MRKMRPSVPLPMLLAASILPGFTFARAVSTCLAKKGTVPKISGTIAPVTPIAVPTIALVKGIKNIKMYDTKMEITFNSPINQSPEYQGFLFCEKIGVMTIYQPVKRIYENIEIDIEMYI